MELKELQEQKQAKKEAEIKENKKSTRKEFIERMRLDTQFQKFLVKPLKEKIERLNSLDSIDPEKSLEQQMIMNKNKVELLRDIIAPFIRK